jgi:hypothetical protein
LSLLLYCELLCKKEVDYFFRFTSPVKRFFVSPGSEPVESFLLFFTLRPNIGRDKSLRYIVGSKNGHVGQGFSPASFDFWPLTSGPLIFWPLVSATDYG